MWTDSTTTEHKASCGDYKRYISAFHENSLRQCPNLRLIFKFSNSALDNIVIMLYIKYPDIVC